MQSPRLIAVATLAGLLFSVPAGAQSPGVRGAPFVDEVAWTSPLAFGAGSTLLAAADTPATSPLAAPGLAGTDSTTPPRSRAAECAATFRMPWGPIKDCSAMISTTAITVAMVAGAIGWWSDGLTTDFKFRNEGWFGPDTYSGGIDKLGHAFSFYVTTRLLNRAYTWAGVNDTDSLFRAAVVAGVIGLSIEVFDGLERSGKYGFSVQDLISDFAGIGLAWYAERNPNFDKWFAVRWKREAVSLGNGTYENHQYFGVLRLSGWDALGVYNPLRYVELGVGYGATGFRGDSEGLVNASNRTRTLYGGIALNLTELLDRTAFSGSWKGGRTQWVATEFLRYVQLPNTMGTTSLKSWNP